MKQTPARLLPALLLQQTCLLLGLLALLPTARAQATQEMPLAALDAGWAEPQSALGTSVLAPQIVWPNGEYRESHVDLRVKILGGHLDITRSWRQSRWWLNPAWAPLNMEPDPLGQDIKTIERAGVLYHKSGQANLYIVAGTQRSPVYIKRLAQTGQGAHWQWYDRQGNTIDYDAQGRILGWMDASGVRVRFAYDSPVQARILDHHGQSIVTASMNAAGLITHIQDYAGRSVSYQWSGQQLVQVTDLSGQHWHYTYNGEGQITTRTDPLGAVATIGYARSLPAPEPRLALGQGGLVLGSETASTGSRLGSLWQVARAAQLEYGGCTTSGSTEYLRQKRQYLTTLTDCAGVSTSVLYDFEGAVVERKRGSAITAKTTWDGRWKKITTDARGQNTSTTYNSQWQPIHMVHPDGSQESWNYDSVRGHKTRHTNRLGVTRAWHYDSAGRITLHTEALGTAQERSTRYAYDTWGQITRRSTGERDGSGADARTWRYQYDKWGNRSHSTNPLGHSSETSYNSAGQPLRQTDALGRSTTWEYNSAGKLLASSDGAGHRTTWQYDALGRRTHSTSAGARTR